MGPGQWQVCELESVPVGGPGELDVQTVFLCGWAPIPTSSGARRRNPRTPKGIKRSFYQQFAKKLNDCISKVFGAAAFQTLGEQTLDNAPILDATRTEADLTRSHPGVEPGNVVVGTINPSNMYTGGYGVIYISNELFHSTGSNAMNAIYGTYTHELGNLLDFRLYGDPKTTHYGDATVDPKDPNKDHDTGSQLEKCVFGAEQKRYP